MASTPVLLVHHLTCPICQSFTMEFELGSSISNRFFYSTPPPPNGSQGRRMSLLHIGCLLSFLCILQWQACLFVLEHVSAFRTGEGHAFLFFSHIIASPDQTFISFSFVPDLLPPSLLYIPDLIWCILSRTWSWPCVHFFYVRRFMEYSFVRYWLLSSAFSYSERIFYHFVIHSE